MILYIFQRGYDGTFKRLKIKIKRFSNKYVVLKNGTIMHLDDDLKSFLKLRIGDLLQVYIKGEDYSKAYVMDYMKDFTPTELGLSLEHQSLLSQVKNSENAKLRTIQEIANQLIEIHSNDNINKFKVLTEAFNMAIQNPEFMTEIKQNLN